MSGPLENFIRDNRDEFDADAPDPRVWEKIKEKVNPESKKETPVRSLPFKRWMAVAASVAVIGFAAVLYLSLHPSGQGGNPVAEKNPKQIDTASHLPVSASPEDSGSRVAKKDQPDPRKINQDGKAQPDPDEILSPENGGNKEMFYYAKLIELKHEELKTLEKDEPLLYRQFSGDVQKLDSVYHALKTQLPNNSNREQVIEAMISNLQLQIGLLNKQLNIIKQIKLSKKSAYEKAYKSV
jgi:hypothetical protein